jgi:hypothetical protein
VDAGLAFLLRRPPLLHVLAGALCVWRCVVCAWVVAGCGVGVQRLAETADQAFPPITIAIVGKYCKLQDAYLSVIKVRPFVVIYATQPDGMCAARLPRVAVGGCVGVWGTRGATGCMCAAAHGGVLCVGALACGGRRA